MEEIYQEAVRQINEIQATIVIHSGDVTDSNKLPEFEIAASKLSHIKHPKLIVPGNNDLKTFGWELFREWIGPLDPFYEDASIRVTGINSVDRTIRNGNIGRRKMKETTGMFPGKRRDHRDLLSSTGKTDTADGRITE